ncbi:MAG: undecaprenyl-phosphate glucose phosphotransferase [Ignavibacteria bacterium]
MRKKSYSSEVLIPLITILSDIIAIEASFAISYWIRFYSPFKNYYPFSGPLPGFTGYMVLSLMVIPIWILIFQSRKMYRPRRVVFIFDEFFLIGRLVTFGVIFAFGLIFFYRVFPYSRYVFVFIWAISIVLITLGRYMVLKIEKNLYNRGKALKNALIIGNNTTALDIYKNFIDHPYAGYNICGYLEEDHSIDIDLPDKGKRLGCYSEIIPVIKQYGIESVLVTIPSNENDKLYEIMKLCEGENVEFLLIPDFLEMITSSVRVQEIDGIPFLKIKSIPMNVWNRIVKRAFDIVFSSLILLLTSPLLLVLALLIKITSKGKVFYKQERVSLEGKKFYMFKFRSMVEGAEQETGAVFASKDDDRSTPIGRFMRKFSFDELPQYINVLKGDMSVVGPRPEREYFINIMKQKIPKYLERHRVKCGITGWAQVNGLRGKDTSMKKRIEYDIYYIENWSIIFDLKIILKTLREMFFSKAAF